MSADHGVCGSVGECVHLYAVGTGPGGWPPKSESQRVSNIQSLDPSCATLLTQKIQTCQSVK